MLYTISPHPVQRGYSIKHNARVTPIFVDWVFLKIVLPKVAGTVLPRHLCVNLVFFFFQYIK